MSGSRRCIVFACPNKPGYCDYHAPRTCARTHVDDTGPQDAAEERAAIVAWLRRSEEDYDASLANAIERGEHHLTAPTGGRS